MGIVVWCLLRMSCIALALVSPGCFAKRLMVGRVEELHFWCPIISISGRGSAY